MSRRAFLQGSSLIAGLAILAACAPKEPTPAPTEPPKAEAQPTPAEAAEKAPQEAVTLMSLGTGNDTIFAAFKERTGITIENVPITGDKFQKLNSMFATGDPPDLFNTSDVNWCKDRDIAVQQHVVLDEYFTRDEDEFQFDDIYPSISKFMKMPDGHYHFTPTYANSNVMAYNIQLFDEAGVPYPTADWTWDDMVQAGKELTIMEGDMVVQYGKATTFGWWGEYYYYQRQAGLEDWLSEDGTEVFMDAPEAIEGLQFYIDCIFKHKMADAPGVGLEGGFLGGGYAMWNFIHTASWPQITQAGIQWDVMVPPKGKRLEGGEMALDSTAIGKGSKHYEESWTYLKFNSGKDGGVLWVEWGYPPIRKSVAEETWIPHKGTPEYPLHPEIYFDSLPYNMPVHWAPGSWDAWGILQQKVDLVLEQKLTVEQACQEAAAEHRALIESGGK
ncbi:MAG: extracellular solute-binding protein [Chloroflexi bacterium]|nr:extracellular solute-binding protein [Chloroflexota bacterium]